MNILLISPFFSGQKHRAEIGVVNALRQLNHNVSIWDHREHKFRHNDLSVEDNFDPNLTNIKSYDLILSLGPGLSQMVLDSVLWRKTKAIRAIWNSEPIRLPQYYSRFEKQKDEYDYIFTFDESEVPIYEKAFNLKGRVFYLPQGFNEEWYTPLNIEPHKDLVFVGSIGDKWGNRVHFLNRIMKSFPNQLTVGTLFEADKVNHIYNNHKAILNLGLYHTSLGPPENLKSFGLQQRIWEAYGAGKVCITNEIPNKSNPLLKHKRDILFYNENNLEEIIYFALNDSNRLKMENFIRNNRLNHTYKSRMYQMIDVICDVS